FAAAGLAILLGVLARRLLPGLARGWRRSRSRRGFAGSGIEPELLHASGEMLGELGCDVERPASRRIDDQPTGVEVHLAADRAGQEGVLTAVLAVADDRMADRRHVHAQLVRAAGQRLQLDPGGTVAGAIDHAVASPGRLAAFGVDVHFFSAGAGLFGERRIDRPVVDIGHADHQGPVYLLRRSAREALRE